MNSKTVPTPLTEQQARALAHWWGGRYEKIWDAAGPGWRHGVVLTRPGGALPAPGGGSRRVLTREEAQAWEARRGFQEACSPDWVG